jgi:hypothetical protein
MKNGKEEEKKQGAAHHFGDTFAAYCRHHKKGFRQRFGYQYHSLHTLLAPGYHSRVVGGNKVGF